MELWDVAKSFDTLSVITDLNLKVEAGHRHALIGPNGAGKSTLFNLISGMFPVTSGEVFLNGAAITGLSAPEINRAGLSRTFQITNIFHRMTVFQNVRIGVLARYNKRFDLFRAVSRQRAINEETDDILNTVGLRHRADHLAGDLSYSEQRALEIGMTLSTGAEVILLDEPTAGMSREETAGTIELIRKVTEGKTLLMVEHDMSVVFSLCDQVSVLVYGNILATDTPEEISRNSEVQKAYLGEDAA